MKTVSVKCGAVNSEIHVGEKLSNVEKYLPHKDVIIITDVNVAKHHSNDFPDCPVITIDTGENIKTLATCEFIYRELIGLAAHRGTFILGVGGGIVCDITGFIASTYMRGLGFGFVSTTLLSQVDASVGGKNGVNFDAYKNMVGLFCQPEFVICDTALLKTLPGEEISNGFAEIVKHGLIADKEMFTYIEDNAEKALALDQGVITKLVLDSVKIKVDVVQQDEKEGGIRRMLNFGHTVGHGLEHITKTSHGRAVSMGMAAAASFSRSRGMIEQGDCLRIEKLLIRLNLPVTYDVLPDLMMDALIKDKKREGQRLHFVFLESLGKARVEDISMQELEQFIRT